MGKTDFTLDNSAANKVAKQWTDVIMGAFQSGTYKKV